MTSQITKCFLCNSNIQSPGGLCDQCLENWHGKCVICFEIHERPVVTNCEHKFCEKCLKDWLKEDMTCPLCRTVVSSRTLYSDIEEEEVKHINELDNLFIVALNDKMDSIIRGDAELNDTIYSIFLKNSGEKAFNLELFGKIQKIFKK